MKTFATALVTAAVCLAIAATTGFARPSGHQYNLKVGDRSVFTSDNLQCQVLAKAQVVCGALKVTNGIHVYYSPTRIEVVKIGATTQKGTVLFNVKR
jgi:hypothetical protein